ncbi:hypothetical protein CDL12_08107 [Handroanthus impetiginosus]|uniref:Uncharacterized protein n=1 Tax=Handroanthus impetiginosus TaxID=429701 RepID=A0A2G9HNW7_9LAMI|nr:hypothetical protein CDL12_08107 [Handroanthus impetiginosus]
MSRICIFFYFFLVFVIIFCNVSFHPGNFMHFANEDENRTRGHVKPEFAYFNHRKLMLQGVCTKWDISISQSRYPTPGIPQYIVQIVNTCTVSNCSPSNIHLHCGWFASARIVNPTTFKRLSFDDCLVNGGHPLKSSQSIRFTYANSFMYPLKFKSASFCN